MAKQTLNIIKNWFRTGLKPTQNQFWDTWDSFWHKDEKIPTNAIENMDSRFDEKADQGAFQSHLNDVDAHSELLAAKANLIGGNTFTGAQQITGDDTLLALDSQQLKVLDLANNLSTTITPNGISWEAEGQAHEYTFPTTSGTLALADDIGNFIKPIEVTYADLVDLINSSSLVANQKYLITDFQTVHTIPNSSPAELNTGPVEPIIITAASSNTITGIAYSTVYPEDIMFYEVVNSLESTKGRIIRREDTKKDVRLPYDFRNAKFRRWKLNPTTWTNIGFTIANIVQYNNKIYYCLQTHSSGQQPDTATNYWQEIIQNNQYHLSPTRTNFTVTRSSINGNYGSIVIPTDVNDYVDVPTFSHYDQVSTVCIEEGAYRSYSNIVVYTDGQNYSFYRNIFKNSSNGITFCLLGTYYCYANNFGYITNSIITANNTGAATADRSISFNTFGSLVTVVINAEATFYNNIHLLNNSIIVKQFAYNLGSTIQYCLTPPVFSKNVFSIIANLTATSNIFIRGTSFTGIIGQTYSTSLGGSNYVWNVNSNLLNKTFVADVISDIHTPDAIAKANTQNVIYYGLPDPTYKSGQTVVTMDGTQTVFNIPHGMTGITASSSFALTFEDASNSTFIQSVRTLTATHIVITCNTAPAAGSQTVYWQVFK
jgi:hypothetical protein